MEVARNIYLEELKRKEGNGMIKIITGVLRCGKSYLLRTINYIDIKLIYLYNMFYFAICQPVKAKVCKIKNRIHEWMRFLSSVLLNGKHTGINNRLSAMPGA